MNSIPNKQSQIENQIASAETQLLEIKKELSIQLSKFREMFNTQNDSVPKRPALIASTVTTAFNEEREREKGNSTPISLNPMPMKVKPVRLQTSNMSQISLNFRSKGWYDQNYKIRGKI